MFGNDPLWYKDAIIYQLHVKVFFDSNNDGIGDFQGLKEKLDYIQDLGVNTLWLMPFYPSPLRDDGYDVSEYKNVHPDYGTMRDFRAFVREAHRRSLKVVTELVINHTSDQHSWFQRARKAPRGSVRRNFYVWSDSDKKYAGTRIIFTDTETSNWAWDPVAGQYYWHRFFSHQPDLNYDNPHVMRAMRRVMHFWMDAGVDGVRLDAIPYLCEREGTNNENLPETHAVLKQMRADLDEHYENRMFLAEANQWPEDVLPYFGKGDECHMAFHFPLMPRIYMALAQEDRHPITEIMRQTPEIPDNCQWTIFLRNHDELTLEMVTDRERDYMYKVYATDPRMRINIGIRRRLAPLIDNDRDRMELLNSLLMSMPGTPIIYYGDELGMGDNIFLGDRDSVRTPMQWTSDRNAGFSRADPARLYLPPIMDPVYGYQAVNVEAQSRSASSLLNWMKRLIAVRKAHKAFGRGTLEFLHPGNRKILAYMREYENESVLCVANLSRFAQPVELDLSRYKGRVPVEMMGRAHFPPIGELTYLLTLPGHSFYWFLLATEAEVPSWHEELPPPPPPELPVVVLSHGWRSLLVWGLQREQLEDEVLPAFLNSRRWFAAKGNSIDRVEMVEPVEWGAGGDSWLLGFAQVHFTDGMSQRYFVPLAIAWEEAGEDPLPALLHHTLAKVRRHARMGVLVDAFADDVFCLALIDAMGEEREVTDVEGKFKFSKTAVFQKLKGDQPLSVRRVGAEQSNTSVILGERLILKVYRRLQAGINPDLEVGRFLTEVAHFSNTPPLAGAIEYVEGDGSSTTVALLHGFVSNQGDGWSYTLDYLSRYLEDSLRMLPEEVDVEDGDAHAVYLSLIHTLGLRTGELHGAFAISSGDPAFDPEPVQPSDISNWVAQVKQDFEETLDLLQRRKADLPEDQKPAADRLLGLRNEFLEQVDKLVPSDLQALKTRHHGDYHLGQVLVVHNDFQLIDFEGEPARAIAERRVKHSPLRDVAGMLRSFNYAAHAALFRVTIDRHSDLPVLESRARDWERRTAQAFLGGYFEDTQGYEPHLVAPEHARDLIKFFTLEKALYEVRYELGNRPDWVEIPVKGILNLLGQDATEGET